MLTVDTYPVETWSAGDCSAQVGSREHLPAAKGWLAGFEGFLEAVGGLHHIFLKRNSGEALKEGDGRPQTSVGDIVRSSRLLLKRGLGKSASLFREL